jgi:ATP-dependent DNA ligase
MTPSSLTTARPRIAPIVPVTRRQPFNDRNWLFEFKYDGFPSVLYLTRQECMFYSKRGWEIS